MRRRLREVRRWMLPIGLGAALAASSSGRFGNTLGRSDTAVSDLTVWLGLGGATILYALLIALLWHVVAKLSDRQATVVLALVVGAAVWSPVELGRAATYLWLAVPRVADCLDSWLEAVPRYPSDEPDHEDDAVHPGS